MLPHTQKILELCPIVLLALLPLAGPGWCAHMDREERGNLPLQEVRLTTPTVFNSACPALHVDKPLRILGPIRTVSLGSSLIILDSNIVAVSLLAIGRPFEMSFDGLQWVVRAYVLVFCALLSSTGNYAGLRGRERAMVVGLIVFALAPVGCGLAHVRSLWRSTAPSKSLSLLLASVQGRWLNVQTSCLQELFP
jgi:hypothetical protein